MRYILTNRAVSEITDPARGGNPIYTSLTPESQYGWRILYPIYIVTPPFLASFVGYAIRHPEINLNSLDCNFEGQIKQQACSDEHGAAFVKACFYPMLGYLMLYPLFAGIKITWFTSKQEHALNPNTLNGDRIGWNIQLAENKTVFPPFNNILNSAAMLFWSAFYTAAYAVAGNWVLHDVPDMDTAKDIAITYAIGALVLGSIPVGLYQLYRVLYDGELKFLPDADYWVESTGCCTVSCDLPSISCAAPVRWLSDCCALPQRLCCPDEAPVVAAVVAERADLENALFSMQDDDRSNPLLRSYRSQTPPLPSAPPASTDRTVGDTISHAFNRYLSLPSEILDSVLHRNENEEQRKRRLEYRGG